MRKIATILFFILGVFSAKAQLQIAYKIDTSQTRNQKCYRFVADFMEQTSINNDFWHPKYKTREVWNYNLDYLWEELPPKQLAEKFNAEIIELQHINDSLSYFKLKLSSKPTSPEPFANIYKYYIIEQNGALYLDNCRVYDANRFTFQQTKNINFYISPFYKISKKQLKKASQSFDSLYVLLQSKRPKSPIAYFMCANEEELNNLANIVVWDGGLTGFTNIPEGYVVGINDNPVYTHEFIHAILGYGANCFFLQEGIATLYGGTDKGKITYEKGINALKKCYQSGGCDFEKLLAREVGTQYSSSLTYTFGAVFCKFLIENYGFEKFYSLYYDKSITTANFMEKVEQLTGKSKAEIKVVVERMILD